MAQQEETPSGPSFPTPHLPCTLGPPAPTGSACPTRPPRRSESSRKAWAVSTCTSISMEGEELVLL